MMSLEEALTVAKRLEVEGSCGTMGLALRALLRGYLGAQESIDQMQEVHESFRAEAKAKFELLQLMESGKYQGTFDKE